MAAAGPAILSPRLPDRLYERLGWRLVPATVVIWNLAAVTITDDGVGGADPNAGSGLSGLADRVAALDGVVDG